MYSSMALLLAPRKCLLADMKQPEAHIVNIDAIERNLNTARRQEEDSRLHLLNTAKDT